MSHREPLEDWEQELHRELNALPDLEAPATLIPAVLNRIQQPQRQAWYQRSWWQWPLAWRAIALVVMLGLVGTLVWMLPLAWQRLVSPALAGGVTEMAAWWKPLGGALSSLAGAGATFWQAHVQHVLLLVAFLMAAVYLTFVAAGTAVYRLAWRRTL